MTPRLPRRHLLLPLCALLLLAGCDDTEQPVTVRGKVLYQGGPLGGAIIVFTPDASRGGSGPLGRAEVQADGSYTLETDDPAGMPAGWYRVTVMALEAAAPAGQGFAIPRSRLPEKYRDPDLSGLTCEIKPGRVNTVNFNLD